MRDLIDFILNYKHWFVFLILEMVSLIGLFRSNGYQNSVYFTTANSIVGYTYSTVSSVTSYLHLGTLNSELEAENEKLRMENIALRHRLHDAVNDSVEYFSKLYQYHTIPAQVINSTLHKSANLMTIDKGEADGIKPEMGVVCSKGIVGVVYMTSKHYSIIMPLLNVNSKISCRLKDSEYFGTLEWQRGDSRIAYATGFPRHAKVKRGEVIETNGYSDIFPPGLPIGKVKKVGDSEDGMSYMLKVELFANFATLRDVSVITNYTHLERRELEEKAEGTD